MENKDLPASDDHKNHSKEFVKKKLGDKIRPVNGDWKKDKKYVSSKNDSRSEDKDEKRDGS